MRISGIYLAAGNSYRMGTNKLTLTLGNKEIGRWGLEKALDSNLDDIILISQHQNRLDLSGLCTQKVMEVEVTKSNAGQSHSLKVGIEQANILHSDAVIILLADQPFITTDMINQLIKIYKQKPTTSFVASSFLDIIQPPILLDNQLFSKILHLTGDQGAKKILKEQMEQGILLPFNDEQLFTDIDCMKEYLFWKKHVESNR
ncbi:nucleotidyltransferase family protein [Peribacillus sp. NPDC097264]|uniref:nucleotidyltransferase family protein n=1 Tax=unclassified Peribacillus TaxID=2675266 RepID=UPI003813C676